MIFHSVSAEHINSLNRLFLLLHRLKVIGSVETEVGRVVDSYGPILYTVIFIKYDPSTKGIMSPEDRLEELLNRTLTS